MSTARRLLLAAIGAIALVVVTPGIAAAHADLDGTDPAEGAVLEASPPAIELTFNEDVEVSLGAIRVFDADGRRLDVGAPKHPDGDGTRVRSSVSELDDGTYVVTWRVLSADAHPIRGAYTFQVGDSATSSREATSLAARLLTEQGGSQTVGILYATARGLAFAGTALLLGGVAFVILVWPGGRGDGRAARLVWLGWWVLFGATLTGFALQGPYASALGLTDALDPSVWSEVWGTRFGQVWAARAVVLLLAVPVLRVLFVRRGPVLEHPLPPWWMPAAVVLGVALSAAPGLGAHAGTGRWVPLAIVADTVHVAAMSLWLGGLVLLGLALLPSSDEATLRVAMPRFSQLALGSVIALVLTGVFQAFRQVGDLSELLDSDYGRLLLVKVGIFLVLVVVAAASRDVVNRRWRIEEPPPAPELVPAGGGVVAVGAEPSPERAAPELDEYPEGYVLDEETAGRRLRRSVLVEVGFAVVILAVTALLVNAPPPREAQSGPFFTTLESDDVSIDVTVTPAQRGDNVLHLYALTPSGGPRDVLEMTAELSQPARDIAPIEIPLIRAGPGHYSSSDFAVPITGDWDLTIKSLLTDVDLVTETTTVPIR